MGDRIGVLLERTTQALNAMRRRHAREFNDLSAELKEAKALGVDRFNSDEIRVMLARQHELTLFLRDDKIAIAYFEQVKQDYAAGRRAWKENPPKPVDYVIPKDLVI